MEQIYNVKYIDAKYTYTKKFIKDKLSLHEAHGYLERNGDNIVISFIKRVPDESGFINEPGKIVEGLVIPDTAVTSVSKKVKFKALDNIKLLSNIAVTWRDVIHVANRDVRDCSILYTEGILTKISKDHILLKNPETIVVYPLPVKNHPQEKASVYMLPKAFILDIEVINKNEKNTKQKK